MSDMVVLCAAFNSLLCMPAMRCTKFFRTAVSSDKNSGKKQKSGKKKRATGKPGPFISVKVKNLQRGTANAVELGGKATVCISYVRYGALMSKQQPFFVHVSHAWVA
ncbi:hypothetical protein LVY75_25905 [Sinorhizobium sp. B11]